MPVPWRMTLAWRLLRLVDRSPVFQQPPDRVRAASEARKRLVASPLTRPAVGRRDRHTVAEDTTATLRDGRRLPVRIYRPAAADTTDRLPLIVNFHGGGFVAGDPRQSEWWTSSVAAGVGAVVVSVEYRLAPEHPYPAATKDCYAATVWAVEHAAELGADPARLAVMGDSAGANLAAVVTLIARDRGGPPIALQVLIYPVVEMIEEFPSERQYPTQPVLTKADMDSATGLYFFGVDPGLAKEEHASPLRAGHAGLPPALIQTAEYDPLRDQGTAYADALRTAGVAVRLTNYVDAVHGYISVPGLVPAARQAVAEAVAELRRALTPAGTPPPQEQQTSTGGPVI